MKNYQERPVTKIKIPISNAAERMKGHAGKKLS
jgi:hypothetical protein